MKKWYHGLLIYYKTAFVAALALIVAISATCCLYWFNFSEVPNGIALGGLIGLLSYLVLGIVESVEAKKKKSIGAIIVTIMRFILLASILYLVAYLYYKLEYRIFNPFAVVGGYLIPLVSFVVIASKENKNASNNS